jgi:small subunit ribosomal protein S2
MESSQDKQENFHFERLSTKEKLELMLNCGMHYPHKRCHPSFKGFLMENQSAIDLRLTLTLLDKALAKIKSLFASGGFALFVGTKPQVTDVIAREARRCLQYWITKHWIGGALTNPEFTLHKSLKRLTTLEEKSSNTELYTKKECNAFVRQHTKSFTRLEGVAGDDEHRKPLPKHHPKLVVIVDPAREFAAIQEVYALRRKCKDVTLMILGDGFGNRFNLRELSDQDLFIPGNDDGTQSVELFLVAVADAILDGLEVFQSKRDADYAVKQEILRASTINTAISKEVAHE